VGTNCDDGLETLKQIEIDTERQTQRDRH